MKEEAGRRRRKGVGRRREGGKEKEGERGSEKVSGKGKAKMSRDIVPCSQFSPIYLFFSPNLIPPLPLPSLLHSFSHPSLFTHHSLPSHPLSLSLSLSLSLPLPYSLCLLHSCLPHFDQPLTDEHVSYVLRLPTDIHPHRPVLPPSTRWFVLDREENFFPHQLLPEKLPCLPCIRLK